MVEVAEVALEFKWGKKRGIGGKKKDVQFYESFTYCGVEYTLYDSVYLYKEEEPEPYIGKLIKIWENADKSKKVKVLWYFRPSEISKFLGNHQTPENELFLACGEGVGLANVNPLEAIVGKCNVICTSKDSRNPQPLDGELQMSDFFFYRTFDVGVRKVLDKIDEKIAGIEVKFIFNQVGCQKSSGVLGSDKKGVDTNAITCDEKVLSAQQKISEGHVTTKSEGVVGETSVKEHIKASVVKQKPSIVEKAASNVDVVLGRRAKASEGLDYVSTENTNLRSKVNENGNSQVPLVKQEFSLEEKRVSGLVGDLGEVANAIDRLENMSSYKTGLWSKDEDNADSNASLVRQKSTLGKKVASGEGEQIHETARPNKRLEKVSADKATSSSKVEFEKSKAKGSNVLEVKEEVKSTKDPGELDNRPFKKAKLNSSLEICDDKIKNSAQKLGHDFDGNITKPTGAIINNEDKSKAKSKLAIAKDSHGIDKYISKKAKVDETLIKPNYGKVTKASPFQPSNIENKTDHGVLEVTRRPSFDRRKWFKELPWEERMRVAHEQGTLILLENLDPSYTSTEVEDIVWHAFKENCSAKMFQRIASTSLYSGQAYVIFKTREAAEVVVTKLDEGCLLLSNGRPLVGSFRSPCFMGKQSTFFGHLVIDKLKFQMQREMREAVSTSHCSQPNTLEYGMAIEWCLLQEKIDCAWKKLYEQQGQELRKLGAGLKTK